MKRTEAIILSMTKQERQKPDILNGSRRMRIANGFAPHCSPDRWSGLFRSGGRRSVGAFLFSPTQFEPQIPQMIADARAVFPLRSLRNLR
jgi:hypothetical protein